MVAVGAIISEITATVDEASELLPASSVAAATLTATVLFLLVVNAKSKV